MTCFVCAICQREVEAALCHDRRRPLRAPICSTCETPSIYGWNGRGRSLGLVPHGSFMDRRIARRLFAIADALECAARRKNWRLAR